jgi:hypothetical protein
MHVNYILMPTGCYDLWVNILYWQERKFNISEHSIKKMIRRQSYARELQRNK